MAAVCDLAELGRSAEARRVLARSLAEVGAVLLPVASTPVAPTVAARAQAAAAAFFVLPAVAKAVVASPPAAGVSRGYGGMEDLNLAFGSGALRRRWNRHSLLPSAVTRIDSFKFVRDRVGWGVLTAPPSSRHPPRCQGDLHRGHQRLLRGPPDAN